MVDYHRRHPTKCRELSDIDGNIVPSSNTWDEFKPFQIFAKNGERVSFHPRNR